MRRGLPDRRNGFSLSGAYSLSLLIMIPIGLVAWGIMRAVELLFQLDLRDHPEVILLSIVAAVALACGASVWWTDRRKRKRRRAEKRGRQQQARDPWEGEPEKMPWE